jgi:hypothetical protein
MNGSTRSRRGVARALGLTVAVVTAAVTVAVTTGTAHAVKADRGMIVRTNDKDDECYYRPGQLIAPAGMGQVIQYFAGGDVKETTSLIPPDVAHYVPPTVTPLSLYSIGGADPFDTALQMSQAGFDSVAPNYLSSYAPVRTWAPGNDAVPTVAPWPVSVAGSTHGKGQRIGVFDTGLQRKIVSSIPGTGTVTYRSAASMRVELASRGLVAPTYIQPAELTTGRAAGHGTFITGLIRRSLPGANIVVVQVPFADATDSQFGVDPSPTFGSDLASRADDAAITYMLLKSFLTSGKTNVNTLSLSFGSYGCNMAFDPEMESDRDFRTPVGLRNALLMLWENSGRTLTVAAAAGNDLTDEPFYPAAFAAVSCFEPSNIPSASPPKCEPTMYAKSPWIAGVTSTVASTGDYSNRGPWAMIEAEGSDVVSLSSDLKWTRWSGTSFAAPCAAVWMASNPGSDWWRFTGSTLKCGLVDPTAPSPP